MQIYTVHHRTEAAGSLTGLAEDAIFVKEGFSWPAFFVPAVWLSYKRMWWVLAAVIVVQGLMAGLAGVLSLPNSIAMICSLAINVIIGFEGNDLYRWTLARKRYRQAAVVTGAGKEEAEFRFFSTLSRTMPSSGALS